MKPDTVTDRAAGLLRSDEADRLVIAYRRQAGIPVNTWEQQQPLEHPPVPPTLVALGITPPGICPVCGFPIGTGVQRLDLPPGHPHFGRLVACQACHNGR